MRTTLVLVAMFWISLGSIVAQNDTSEYFAWPPTVAATNAAPDYVPTPESDPIRLILPEDVEQDSIKTWRHSTNFFGVSWTYTEMGAKKMLSFRREHAGQQVILRIGNFECHPKLMPIENRPSWWTEEGYLSHRSDKFIGVDQDEADAIVEGLAKK